MKSLGVIENSRDKEEGGKKEFRQRNSLDLEREPSLYARLIDTKSHKT